MELTDPIKAQVINDIMENISEMEKEQRIFDYLSKNTPIISDRIRYKKQSKKIGTAITNWKFHLQAAKKLS